MCYFLPPSSAVCCFSHVSADTSSALGFCMICWGAHPKEEAQGKQGDPNLGIEGMGGEWATVEHGWGKAEALRLQTGWQAARNIGTERHGCAVLREESQVWKPGENMGPQWENRILHEVSERLEAWDEREGICYAYRKKWGYCHQQHCAMQNKTKFSYWVSLLKEAVSGVTSTDISYCSVFINLPTLISFYIPVILVFLSVLLDLSLYSISIFQKDCCFLVGKETTHCGMELSFLPHLLWILF